MLQFVFDTCSAVKPSEEIWIVGLEAEAVGVVSPRREVNIQSRWTREAAVHPLAVHFCSIQCKDDYMTRLFGSTPVEQVVVESTAPALAEVVVEREIPAAKNITKTRGGRRRKAS
jgi:hypothetical protein